MATPDNDVRRRTVPAASPADSKPSSTKSPIPDQSTSSSYIALEVLRALAGLTILTALASYFMTSGESLIFNQNKRLTTLTNYFSNTSPTSPSVFTPSSLAAYDGSDASKPIYMSINRTVYDVSAAPHIYGPGGMYGFFGGKDASRSFVTTCFDPVNDLVPDLEGVEEIYVPLWLSKKSKDEVKEEWDVVLSDLGGQLGGKSAADLLGDVKKRLGPKMVKELRDEAYAEAGERVQAALGNWKRMLEGKNYPVVGTLQYPEPGTTEEENQARIKRTMKLPLCKDALKNRPSMTDSLTKAMSAMVKGGKLDINKMGKAQAEAVGGADAGKVEKAGKAGQAAAAAVAGEGAGRDSKAREAIKEQVQHGHADEQKKKEKAPGGHGHAGMPPHGAGGMPAGHGANPHANVPPHHHGAQKPLGHGGAAAEREQLKQGKVMDHAEAGGAAEAVGGVPPHGGNKARGDA